MIRDFKLANFLITPFPLNKNVVFLKNFNDYFIDNLDKLFFLILKQKKQNFIFGRIFTRAFALTEKKNKRERFFSNQK